MFVMVILHYVFVMRVLVVVFDFYCSLYAVGRTMFEGDRLPKSWITRINTMDEIWVTSKQQKRSLYFFLLCL